MLKRLRNQFGDRCVVTARPTLWNSLPEQLRQPDITFRQFKRSLKTSVFGYLQAAAPYVRTLRALTRNLITYLLIYLFVEICAKYESDWRCFRDCAISSSHGHPQDIFFQGGWANSGMQKSDDILVVALKTLVFSVTTNARNTYQHLKGKCSQNISIFIEGVPVFVEGGRLYHGTVARWPVQSWYVTALVLVVV